MTDERRETAKPGHEMSRRGLLASAAGAGLSVIPNIADARKAAPEFPIFSRIPTIFTPNKVDYQAGRKPNRPGKRNSDDVASSARDRISLPTGPAAIRLKVNDVEARHGAWFGRNKDVYIVTTVVDGLSSEPIVYDGGKYNSVPDGGRLPIDLLNVYLRDPIDELPRILDFNIVVFVCNESAREWGSVIGELQASKDFKALNAAVTTALSAANPLYNIAWIAGNAALNLVGQVLKATADDQLGYYEARFTRTFDGLGVGVHPRDGGLIHAGRMSVAYEIDVMDLAVAGS